MGIRNRLKTDGPSGHGGSNPPPGTSGFTFRNPPGPRRPQVGIPLGTGGFTPGEALVAVDMREITLFPAQPQLLDRLSDGIAEAVVGIVEIWAISSKSGTITATKSLLPCPSD